MQIKVFNSLVRLRIEQCNIKVRDKRTNTYKQIQDRQRKKTRKKKIKVHIFSLYMHRDRSCRTSSSVDDLHLQQEAQKNDIRKTKERKGYYLTAKSTWMFIFSKSWELSALIRVSCISWENPKREMRGSAIDGSHRQGRKEEKNRRQLVRRHL